MPKLSPELKAYFRHRIRHIHVPDLAPHFAPRSLPLNLRDYLEAQIAEQRKVASGYDGRHVEPPKATDDEARVEHMRSWLSWQSPPPTVLSFTRRPTYVLPAQYMRGREPWEIEYLTNGLKSKQQVIFPRPPSWHAAPYIGHWEDESVQQDPLVREWTPGVMSFPCKEPMYFGPGQITIWPVIDLLDQFQRGKDFKTKYEYERLLEDTTIKVLKREYGLDAFALPGKSGVWVESLIPPDELTEAKEQPDEFGIKRYEMNQPKIYERIRRIATVHADFADDITRFGVSIHVSDPQSTNPWASIGQAHITTSIASELAIKGRAPERRDPDQMELKDRSDRKSLYLQTRFDENSPLISKPLVAMPYSLVSFDPGVSFSCPLGLDNRDLSVAWTNEFARQLGFMDGIIDHLSIVRYKSILAREGSKTHSADIGWYSRVVMNEDILVSPYQQVEVTPIELRVSKGVTQRVVEATKRGEFRDGRLPAQVTETTKARSWPLWYDKVTKFLDMGIRGFRWDTRLAQLVHQLRSQAKAEHRWQAIQDNTVLREGWRIHQNPRVYKTRMYMDKVLLSEITKAVEGTKELLETVEAGHINVPKAQLQTKLEQLNLMLESVNLVSPGNKDSRRDSNSLRDDEPESTTTEPSAAEKDAEQGIFSWAFRPALAARVQAAIFGPKTAAATKDQPVEPRDALQPKQYLVADRPRSDSAVSTRLEALPEAIEQDLSDANLGTYPFTVFSDPAAAYGPMSPRLHATPEAVEQDQSNQTIAIDPALSSPGSELSSEQTTPPRVAVEEQQQQQNTRAEVTQKKPTEPAPPRPAQTPRVAPLLRPAQLEMGPHGHERPQLLPTKRQARIDAAIARAAARILKRRADNNNTDERTDAAQPQPDAVPAKVDNHDNITNERTDAAQPQPDAVLAKVDNYDNNTDERTEPAQPPPDAVPAKVDNYDNNTDERTNPAQPQPAAAPSVPPQLRMLGPVVWRDRTRVKHKQPPPREPPVPTSDDELSAEGKASLAQIDGYMTKLIALKLGEPDPRGGPFYEQLPLRTRASEIERAWSHLRHKIKTWDHRIVLRRLQDWQAPKRKKMARGPVGPPHYDEPPKPKLQGDGCAGFQWAKPEGGEEDGAGVAGVGDGFQWAKPEGWEEDGVDVAQVGEAEQVAQVDAFLKLIGAVGDAGETGAEAEEAGETKEDGGMKAEEVGETEAVEAGETTPEEASETTAEEASETTAEEAGETTAEEAGEITAKEAGETKALEAGETKALEAAETKAEEAGETTAKESGEIEAVKASETTAEEAGETMAEEASETTAKEASETKAEEAGEIKAEEAGELKAEEVGEITAEEVGEISAEEAGETTAEDAGKTKAEEVGESKIKETKADEVGELKTEETKAEEVGESKTEETKAEEAGETTAEDAGKTKSEEVGESKTEETKAEEAGETTAEEAGETKAEKVGESKTEETKAD